MYIFVSGAIIFFAIHLVPSFAEFRRKLIGRLGKGPYLGLFAVISLVGFVLMINGKSKIDFRPLWDAPDWSTGVVAALMVLSMVLIVSAYLKSNIKRFTRHPMLWGVTLWSGAHMLVNGDLGSLLFFGSLFVFSLFDMLSANRRGATKQLTRYPLSKDAVTLVTGLVIYGVFIYLHPYLFGVSII